MSRVREVVSPGTQWLRIAFNIAVLCCVAVTPGIAPGATLLELTESEVPVEADESSEEIVIRIRSHARIRPDEPSRPLTTSVHRDHRRVTASKASHPISGHRLSNGLIAPQRC